MCVGWYCLSTKSSSFRGYSARISSWNSTGETETFFDDGALFVSASDPIFRCGRDI